MTDTQPALIARLKVVQETLRDIAENFDCDADAHKYGTTCRTCAASVSLPDIYNVIAALADAPVPTPSDPLLEGAEYIVEQLASTACPTHGDPLVCLACEVEEDARPEWQRPHRVSPPRLRGEPERGSECRCSGCGLRWTAPEGFVTSTGATLCGDCWRKAQPVLHAQPRRPRRGISSEPLVHGQTCRKVMHDKPSGGYLHGEDDDTPYMVDGWPYCGRCHSALER